MEIIPVEKGTNKKINSHDCLKLHLDEFVHLKLNGITMGKRKNKNAGVVYSSDHGRMCPACGKAITQCSCRSKGSTVRGDGIVRVGRSTKGRKGKGVTVISGIPLEGNALQELAKRLKQKCGSGGTIKDGIIEIQGDHRDMLVEELTTQGYTVKRSGG